MGTGPDGQAAQVDPQAALSEAIAGALNEHGFLFQQAVQHVVPKTPSNGYAGDADWEFDVAEFPQDNAYVQKEQAWREEHGESRTA